MPNNSSRQAFSQKLYAQVLNMKPGEKIHFTRRQLACELAPYREGLRADLLGMIPPSARDEVSVDFDVATSTVTILMNGNDNADS